MTRKITLLSSLILALSVTTVYAEDTIPSATIHFTGSVIVPSCEFDNGGEQTVTLGSFPTTDFPVVGAEATGTSFTITLNNCPTPTSSLGRVQMTFTGPTVTSHPELLQVSKITTEDAGDTAATNIGIAINPAWNPQPVSSSSMARMSRFILICHLPLIHKYHRTFLPATLLTPSR